MNGAARMPKHPEFADAPVAISSLKGPWWKYSHTAPRSSPPPRLLLALLLLAQLLFLAIVRLGPVRLVWNLSSTDGLPSSSQMPMRMRRPFDAVPLKAGELVEESSISSSTLSRNGADPETTTVTKEIPTHTDSTSDPESDDENASDADSATHSAASVDKLNGDISTALQVETAERTSKAAAMATSLEEAKKEQTLVVEKVYGNQGSSEEDPRVKAHHGAHELVKPEERTPPEVEASEMVYSTGKGEHTLLAMKEHGELASLDGEMVHAQSVGEEVASSSVCSYGYVYVYDLPPMYNKDIIANCTALNVYVDVCDTLLNGGLGPSLGDLSPLGQVGSWFTSDQFTTEMMFHRRMLQHPCLTDKPEKATSFYVPYYVGLDVGRYLWAGFSAKDRDRLSNHVMNWLVQQPSWKRNGGWGHFLMVGRISWDFRRSTDEAWGSGVFYHPSMQNVTRLLIEKNPWDYMEMAVPYPTNFHPQSDTDLVSWQTHIRGLTRSSLFSFAGAPRSAFPNDFRGILLHQCKQARSCRSLDCSSRTCDNNQRTLELFMDSNFCLQPRGDSFTRRSTFDCLLAGSIPVFFWQRTAYMQYEWHLPEDWRSYSVFISKDAMRNGTRIEEVLNTYTPEKVRQMREVVIGMIPRIVYAATGSALKEHRDAFDVAIEGVMKRFKEELHLSSQRR